MRNSFCSTQPNLHLYLYFFSLFCHSPCICFFARCFLSVFLHQVAVYWTSPCKFKSILVLRSTFKYFFTLSVSIYRLETYLQLTRSFIRWRISWTKNSGPWNLFLFCFLVLKIRKASWLNYPAARQSILILHDVNIFKVANNTNKLFDNNKAVEVTMGEDDSKVVDKARKLRTRPRWSTTPKWSKMPRCLTIGW